MCGGVPRVSGDWPSFFVYQVEGDGQSVAANWLSGPAGTYVFGLEI